MKLTGTPESPTVNPRHRHQAVPPVHRRPPSSIKRTDLPGLGPGLTLRQPDSRGGFRRLVGVFKNTCFMNRHQSFPTARKQP